MSSPSAFLGEVALFPHDRVPRGWAPCDGSILRISTNTALFSLLGTTYGGDGRSNFQLPDLRGHVPLGPGMQEGGSSYELGDMGGLAAVPLTTAHLPVHQHATRGSSASASTENPVGAVPAVGSVELYTTNPTSDWQLAGVGGGQAHSNLQPSLGVQYCIAVQGIFPPRS